MTGKSYYLATETFRHFLREIDGKLAKLAAEARLTARTISRIKAGGRANAATVKDIHKASCKEAFGFTGDFSSAFMREDQMESYKVAVIDVH